MTLTPGSQYGRRTEPSTSKLLGLASPSQALQPHVIIYVGVLLIARFVTQVKFIDKTILIGGLIFCQLALSVRYYTVYACL